MAGTGRVETKLIINKLIVLHFDIIAVGQSTGNLQTQ
jgi:hypothetical protein